MDQPKWYKSDVDLQPGDIVLFLKNDSSLSSNYQFGMVNSVEAGKDGRIRKARVKYRNSSESVDRESFHAVRELVVIHHVDDINLNEQLSKMAMIQS